MRVTDVLYDAGAPIDEDRARALAVNEVLREPLSDHLDGIHSMYRTCLYLGVAGVLLGVGALVAGAGFPLGATLLVGGMAVAGGGYAYARTRTPDVTVTGIEKGYWTGHCIPNENGVMVYDGSSSLEPTAFDLENLSNEDAVETARRRLDAFDEFPIVMPEGENVEEQFTTALEDVRDAIENAENRTVEAPVVPADGPAARAVEFFAEVAEDEPKSVSADVAVSAAEAREDVESLSELERMADAEEEEAELETISESSRRLVNDLSGMQETAIDLLNDHVGTAADAFGLVSYNFYCPDCQRDEIDSELTLSDPEAGEWYCSTCRSHHETEVVIPRHRIKDDVVNPVWDQLWIEKDDQRREIYENIEDQKSDLEEREFEQCQEEIRNSANRIRDLRSRIRDLQTEAKAAEGKVDEIGDLMVKYERLHEERKRQFQDDVEAAYEDIDEETERILEETRNEEQERIERAQEAAQQKAALMREEERRREAAKFVAQQQLENERTEAKIGASAQQHQEEMDMEKRQHRENWMLKTRGRTSFSSRIDKAKMQKDRLTRAKVHTDGGTN